MVNSANGIGVGVGCVLDSLRSEGTDTPLVKEGPFERKKRNTPMTITAMAIKPIKGFITVSPYPTISYFLRAIVRSSSVAPRSVF